MRSTQVHRALLVVPNRYALCQTIAQSARLLHKTGEPIDGSLNAALIVLGNSKEFAEGQPEAPIQPRHFARQQRSYRQMQYTL